VSLRQKTICMILFITLALALTAAVVSYRMYSHSIEEHYKALSRNVAWTALSVADGMELEHIIERTAEIYLQNPAPVFESGEEEADYFKQYDKVMDEGYGRLYGMLWKVGKANNAASISIIYADASSGTYVYVVDGRNTDNQYPMGTWKEISGQDNSMLENPKQGLKAHIVNQEESGWVCRAGVPVMRADGSVAAFAVVEMPVGSMIRDRQNYLVKLCLVLGIVTATLIYLFKNTIRRMEDGNADEIYELPGTEEELKAAPTEAEGKKEVS